MSVSPITFWQLVPICYCYPDDTRLIHSDMADFEKEIVRNVLEPIEQEREVIIEQALTVIHPGMTGSDTALLLSVVSQIFPEHRKSVMDESRRLISELFDAAEREAIIRAVAEILIEDRESVVTYALNLIVPCINGYEIAFLLKVISGIHPSDRRDIIGRILSLRRADPPIFFTHFGEDVTGLVIVLAMIPIEDRQIAIADAAALIEPDMPQNERINILGFFGWTYAKMRGVPYDWQ